MTVTERKVGDVTIVDVAGKMMASDTSGRLKDKITSLMFQGEKRIVLNLAEVSYVDSSGLGEMVACYGSVTRGGGELKLASAGNKIRDLLVMTRLVTIFDAHDTEDEAIKSFSQR